jgi:hypothetical protein
MQENTKPKMLLEVVREVIRLRHLSYKTEKHNPKFGSCGSENGASTQNHCGF